MKLVDLTDHRFGRLVVVRRASNIGEKTAWYCRCDCGGTKIARSHCLAGNLTASCGCLVVETSAAIGKANETHGKSHTREWRSWRAMRQRCYSRKHVAYLAYGGRGIRVCAQWVVSFENFYADMGPRPRGKTLDRIDNNGNYEPGNCRWATALEQRHNRQR